MGNLPGTGANDIFRISRVQKKYKGKADEEAIIYLIWS